MSIPPHTRYNPFVHVLLHLLLSWGSLKWPPAKQLPKVEDLGQHGPCGENPVCARLSVRCHPASPKRVIYSLSVRVRCPCDLDSEFQS